jgi:hypothetical protein
MNPVPPLPFPGSRTVAAWWRELAPHQPLRLWLCHLLVHRVEALAEVENERPLPAFRIEVLRSLNPGRRPEGLAPGLLARMTRELITAGLLTPTEFGAEPTAAGRHALANGTVTVHSLERRSFCFVDNRAAQQPPHLIHLCRRGTPVFPPEPWEFTPDMLRAAASQSDDWKARFGFPGDVRSIRLPEGNVLPSDDAWRAVVFDQAEYLFVAFIEVAGTDQGSRLCGFAAQPDNWSLDARAPAIELGESWQEALADVAKDPSADQWRNAWQARCQQRGLAAGDAAASQLQRSGIVLNVQAPQKLMIRLREIRADDIKGEGWLLAGTGRARAAARIELVERTG